MENALRQIYQIHLPQNEIVKYTLDELKKYFPVSTDPVSFSTLFFVFSKQIVILVVPICDVLPVLFIMKPRNLLAHMAVRLKIKKLEESHNAMRTYSKFLLISASFKPITKDLYLL